MHGFSNLAEPFNVQLQKDASFEWTASCQKAFEALNLAITRANTLFSFDTMLPTVFITNASPVALAIDVTDTGKRQRTAVAFAFLTISNAERNYCAGKTVALACILVAEHFQLYLYG